MNTFEKWVLRKLVNKNLIQTNGVSEINKIIYDECKLWYTEQNDITTQAFLLEELEDTFKENP